MALITIREALRQALDEEMARDDSVYLMGEEVAQYNGAYKVTQGLWEKYGNERVIDTPITEEGFAGIGIGSAMAGLRPVVEFMTFNFAIQALDQIINNAAKYRYMSGGQLKVPIVFRGPNGPAEYLSAQHSQSLASFFAHIPGLKVIAPATAYDMKGLMKTAIRDDNPVVVLEAEMSYGWQGEVPEEEYLIPFGKADVKKEGKDITLITFSKPLKMVMESAGILEKDGISAEVIDLRSLRPLDTQSVFNSVRKTNRCVVVDEGWPVAGFGSYVSDLVFRNCFDDLDSPVELVTGEDVPMPYNHTLELMAQPSAEKIIKAVRRALYMD